MDVESSFPYEGIEADLGEITAWEQFCGDIYRVTAICPDTLLPDEYYIFPADTQILSAAAELLPEDTLKVQILVDDADIRTLLF